MGSSVAERAQTVAAREARAAGLQWTFGPMVDIARDARWGRIVEGAGEDPYLGSAMAAAQVRGFQGPALSAAEDRVVASVKHYAGYGAADGGRDYDPVYLSDAQLRNVYLPPFHAAAKAGAGTFMSAYMDLNNVPATGNSFLLRDVLKGEWGFQGFVVSDAMAVGNLVIQGFARDGRDAAYRALHAGVDMDMASGTYPQNLAGLVNDGTLKIAEIDDASGASWRSRCGWACSSIHTPTSRCWRRSSHRRSTRANRGGRRSARWCCSGTTAKRSRCRRI